MDSERERAKKHTIKGYITRRVRNVVWTKWFVHNENIDIEKEHDIELMTALSFMFDSDRQIDKHVDKGQGPVKCNSKKEK